MITDELLKAALEECRDANGVITPDAVVAAAKDPDSPLHEFFDWDVESAAQKHWLDTARSLIRRVRVVVTNETVTFQVPAYIRNPDAASDEQGYVSIQSLRTDEDRAREVIVREFALVAGALARAKAIAAYLELTEEIEELQLKIQRLSAAVQTAQH